MDSQNKVSNLKQYWAGVKFAFDDMEKEDCETLLKLIIIKEINLLWNNGFTNLLKLELLSKVFNTDGLLIEMHRQLNTKANDFMLNLNTENINSYPEFIFKGEPVVYKHNGESYTTWYDTMNDWILKKLINKYPKLESQIMEVVYK